MYSCISAVIFKHSAPPSNQTGDMASLRAAALVAGVLLLVLVHGAAAKTNPDQCKGKNADKLCPVFFDPACSEQQPHVASYLPRPPRRLQTRR